VTRRTACHFLTTTCPRLTSPLGLWDAHPDDHGNLIRGLKVSNGNYPPLSNDLSPPMALFNLLHIFPSSKANTGPVQKLHSHLVLVAADNGANVQHHLGRNRNGVDPESLAGQFIPPVPSGFERAMGLDAPSTPRSFRWTTRSCW